MRQVREIRRDNLQRLLAGYRFQRQFAEATGLAAAHVSQMVNGTRDMGEDVARRVEKALGLPANWMDRVEGSAPESLVIDLEQLPADELGLLADYRRLTERHREMLRETAAGYLSLEVSHR